MSEYTLDNLLQHADETVAGDLYEKFKSEDTGIYPTMHELNEGLEKKKKEKIPRNEIGYIDTLRSKIDSICVDFLIK